MAADDRAGFPNPIPLMVMLLFAAGVIVPNMPLESGRPGDAEVKTSVQLGRQDVQARLWQDPLAAVDRHRKVNGGQLTDGHKTAMLAGQIKDKQRVTVLAVMVFGGAYPQHTEYRRRIRYAVVSALGASAYVPENADGLGYISWTKPKRKDSATDERESRVTIPYEWFERSSDLHRASMTQADGLREKVLVLWLEDEAFGRHVVDMLSALTKDLCGATQECQFGVDANPLRVVGPAGSETLKVLVSELHDSAGSKPKENENKGAPVQAASAAEGFPTTGRSGDEHLPKTFAVSKESKSADAEKSKAGGVRMRFYSPYATLPDGRLLEGARHSALVPSEWRNRVSILRTIGTDDALVAALVDELELRNVNPRDGQRMSPCRDAIAIVSEWDTHYARGLKGVVEEELHKRCGASGVRVEWFSYLRGLDGVMPGEDRGNDDGKEDRSKKRETAGDLLAAAVPRDSVEGRSQYDYLRRMGEQLEAFDRNERRTHGRGVRAIGVLGSDVYDKLLILQALRSRFPRAIFFTTDLDARLAHPNHSEWTRNLIVASSFGLSLNPGLQREVPPFRDAYQTAAFFAARLALLSVSDQHAAELRKTLNAWLDGVPPEGGERAYGAAPFRGKKIYEIGRTRPIELDPNGATEWCSGFHQQCASIHPYREHNYPTFADAPRRNVMLAMLMLTGVTILAGLTSQRVWNGVSTWWRSRFRVRLLIAIALALVGAIAFWWGPVTSIDSGRGEPFLWLEGVSIWPTMLLYFVAIVLSVSFLWAGWCQLRRVFAFSASKGESKQQTDSAESQSAVPPSASKSAEISRHAKDLLRVWFRGPLRPLRPKSESTDQPLDFDGTKFGDVWTEYRARHQLSQMVPWIALTSLAFTLFAYALVSLDMPFFPHRGALARMTNWILVNASVLAFIVLVFAVVYVTRSCADFVRTVRLPDNQMWNGFELIVRLTKIVNRFIYSPFIVLLLLIVVRSNFFDALNFPTAAAAVVLVALAYAMFCAFSLRRAAEEARQRALTTASKRFPSWRARTPNVNAPKWRVFAT
jgi:hypothetical protein